MKNHSKGNNNKNEIELLLREALRIKQKPSQEINDSIIRQHEKNIEQRKINVKGFRISLLLSECSKSFD